LAVSSGQRLPGKSVPPGALLTSFKKQLNQDIMNPTFYIHVAISTVIIIVFALLLGTHSFKRKKRLSLAFEQPSPMWYASECFMFLKATILTCNTPDELKKCRGQVEIFYDREFRAPITKCERKKYYSRLLKAIVAKEDSWNAKVLDPSTEAFYHM
jgi:hypothetical protein